MEDTIDPAVRTDTMNHSSLINSSSKGIQIARRRLQIRPERSE
jgi:hypothetical protein